MTKEKREQAEDWAVSLAAVLHGVAGEEVAALLRAGIAASEEGERLRAEVSEMKNTVTRLAGMLYDEQLRRMRQPEGADVRKILRRLSDEDISNGKAAEIILDFIAGAQFQLGLAAWGAEWRAQFVLPPHKAGLYLNHNEHLCYYETAQQWIEDREAQDLADDWSSPDARQRCIDTNEVWVLHWYPQTPTGFFCIAGPTLEEVLAAAREAK